MMFVCNLKIKLYIMYHKTLNNLNMDTVNISVLAGHVNVASAIHDRLYVCINADKNDLVNEVISECGGQYILSRMEQNEIISYLESLGYKVE